MRTFCTNFAPLNFKRLMEACAWRGSSGNTTVAAPSLGEDGVGREGENYFGILSSAHLGSSMEVLVREEFCQEIFFLAPA